MIADTDRAQRVWPWLWGLAFAVLALYVAARMGAFALTVDVATPSGNLRLPNTFASVDHPFHVARAETLWRELAAGRVLRWVGQHQGGYPVEFYPLGESWMEALVRTLSLGRLSAQGAHTLAIVLIFLLPGLAFAALARLDHWPAAVGFLALVMHVSLPGGWYHGGYTELVQWGLATNVAGSVLALLALPAMVRFAQGGPGWTGALAALLAAWAVFSNPRSAVGLLAVGLGSWAAVTAMSRSAGSGADNVRFDDVEGRIALPVFLRVLLVAVIAALMAAPLLVSLVRFGSLYQFVHYSGYSAIVDYAEESLAAVSVPVLALALVGLGFGVFSPRLGGTRAVAVSMLVYILLTVALAFIPVFSQAAPQLEPTRLMPLQRLLTFYLAAVALWRLLDWLTRRIPFNQAVAAPGLAAAIGLIALAIQTRPIFESAPDPASPLIPAVSLYPVAMSGQPVQADLEFAVRAADEAAVDGAAVLVLGSALSWHQQLWAPLWTSRPLYYDNWLWYWHPYHAGTPGYRFAAGHHYPDPEATITSDYLRTHGIGAVVVTGAARASASRSPLLEPVRKGVYDTYVVRNPTTTVTFGQANAALTDSQNTSIQVVAASPSAQITARVNWHPRWSVWADGSAAPVRRSVSGYIEAQSAQPSRTAEIDYIVQPADWAARVLSIIGGAAMLWLAMARRAGETKGAGWYARQQGWPGGRVGAGH